MENKLKKTIIMIAVFQILLLVNTLPSSSYISNKILSIKQVGEVSAQGELGNYCCPKTNNGEICKDVGFDDSNCAVGLLKGSCEENNCVRCCPETNNGEICKNVSLYYSNCSYNLLSGDCEKTNCLHCCPETKQGDFCKDVHLYYNNCAENLVSKSCKSNNCRVILLNKQTKTATLNENPSSSSKITCCPEAKNGAICQDMISQNNCATNLVPSKCDEYSGCKLGCCIDEDEGLCTTKAPKDKCESGGGKWVDDGNCLVDECQKACCVLGGNSEFVTEKRCDKLSSLFGFKKEFRADLKSEIDCLALSENQPTGACVFEKGFCRFGTKQTCLRRGGKFFEGLLCSNPSLNTTCKKQASVGCAENKYEIYWFDSCGNQGNIYSSDKNASWNNGKILSKKQSCNPDSANINSESCGNCNYFLGSKCSKSSSIKVKDGDFVCKNLSCVDENGNVRENGESWCVYDSYIGDGKDPAGSRHWKRMCINGKIETEPCADYRGQICVQSALHKNNSEKNFTIASCTINTALECIGYNSQKNKVQLCEQNPDCILKKIDVDSGFRFNVCVGKYPRGFDLIDETNSNSKKICGLASLTCDMVYEKDWKGHWNCIKNCNCKRSGFTQQMNDFCISLGDCGSYINYVGGGTDNILVDNAPQISWKNYIHYSTPIKSQYASPKNEIIQSIVNPAEPLNLNHVSKITRDLKFLGRISGGAGALISAANFLGVGAGEVSLGGVKLAQSLTTIETVSSSGEVLSSTATTIGAFGAALTGISLGMMIGGYLAKGLGIQGNGAAMMEIAGAVAGATIGYGFATKAISFKALNFAWAGWTMVWISLAVMAYIAIIGWGKTKIVKVKFTCMPWQPPLGGKNCAKCNTDSLKPCTEYKCSSLGKACKLINKNSENPTCIASKNDYSPPIIFPSSISENYTFQNTTSTSIHIRTKNGKCIPEFTPVKFTLSTNKYSQCKYSFKRTKNYNSMEQYPSEQTSFTKNHTFIIAMPSLGSLGVSNFTKYLKDLYADMNIYVRCEDSYGNFNLNEYNINFCVNSGIDITPSRIVAITPPDDSHLKYNFHETNFTIFLNEPAECRYDYNDKSYDAMEKSMQCKINLTDLTDYGWPCSALAENLNKKENKIYIRCKDQPWLGKANKSRNVNTESYVYKIYSTENPLVIDSISPSGEIKTGFEPNSINLEIKTSGGSSNGLAMCYYKIPSINNKFIQFFNTNSDEHKQTLQLMGGDYNVYAKCEDESGNIIENSTKLKIIVDESPPKITRIYNDDGNLVVLTDEDAQCYYDLKTCNFETKNATTMDAVFSKEHEAKFTRGKIYHIKCADIWSNTPNYCSIKIMSI